MSLALAYLTCALVWGTTWFAIRVSTGPGGFGPFESLAVRFTLATAVLAPVVLGLRLQPWPRGRTWMWIVFAGVLDATSYTLVYLGEGRIPGGLAAVLFSTQPLMLAGLLTITGFERVRVPDILGAVVALGGVAVIFADRWQVSPSQAGGLGMVLGAVAASASYSMVLKRHAGDSHPLVVTLCFLAVTALVLDAVAVVHGLRFPAWPPPRDPTLAILYLAVMGSVITFAAWLWLLRRLSLMATTTLVFILPVVALIVDAMWEHDVRIGPRAYAGIAIVFAGLGVSTLSRRSPRR